VIERVLLIIAASVAFPLPCVSAETPAACTIGRYTVMSLPLRPAAINDAGQVAGTTADHRAAVWSAKDGLHELPLPPGFAHAEAVAINGRGHVVGVAFDQAFANQQPFMFADDVLTLLPGEKARAYGINESNTVSGESLLPGKLRTEPVLWSGKNFRPIPACCGGTAKSINALGQVVGDAYDDEGRYYAFQWTEKSPIERIGPPDRYSSAIAINNRGHVVIQAFPGVFLYSGSLLRLTLAPKYPSQARALNDCDAIVGSFGPFADADRAFAWDKSLGFQDLNTRISSDAGWKLEAATGINNRGVIVGYGDAKGVDDAGFMLEPSPPRVGRADTP
jgi:probable HAF family extracellular repeat protein